MIKYEQTSRASLEEMIKYEQTSTPFYGVTVCALSDVGVYRYIYC